MSLLRHLSLQTACSAIPVLRRVREKALMCDLSSIFLVIRLGVMFFPVLTPLSLKMKSTRLTKTKTNKETHSVSSLSDYLILSDLGKMNLTSFSSIQYFSHTVHLDHLTVQNYTQGSNQSCIFFFEAFSSMGYYFYYFF